MFIRNYFVTFQQSWKIMRMNSNYYIYILHIMNKLREKYPWPINKPDVTPVNHGWFSNDTKVNGLKKLLKSRSIKVVLEIGSWLGESTKLILNNIPKDACLISIDHWKGSPEHTNKFSFLPVLYETFLVNCWDHRNRLIPIRENSIAGLKAVNDCGITPDLILIDASHEYADVLKDIQTCVEYFWSHAPMRIDPKDRKDQEYFWNSEQSSVPIICGDSECIDPKDQKLPIICGDDYLWNRSKKIGSGNYPVQRAVKDFCEQSKTPHYNIGNLWILGKN